MTPPHRINVLPNEDGRTFLETCLVVIRESYATFKNLPKDLPGDAFYSRSHEFNILIHHENIHYIQSFTCGYLIIRTIEIHNILKTIIKKAKLRESINKELAQYKNKRDEISLKVNDLSVLALIEGVAVLESFKFCHSNYTSEDYENFLSHYFNDKELSIIYTKSYQLLKEKVGADSAVELLPPLSFLCLTFDDPIGVFYDILQTLDSNIALTLKNYSLRNIFESSGLKIENHFLFNYKTGELKQNPILFPIIDFTVEKFGAEQLLEIASRPSKLMSSLEPSLIYTLTPPMTIFSKSPTEKHTGILNGIAKEKGLENPIVTSIMAMTSIIGTVETLLAANGKGASYLFCPHTKCPHHSTNFCSKYYAPPSIELGYSECRFPIDFQKIFSMLPNELAATYRLQ